jgi:hypothetical protein
MSVRRILHWQSYFDFAWWVVHHVEDYLLTRVAMMWHTCSFAAFRKSQAFMPPLKSIALLWCNVFSVEENHIMSVCTTFRKLVLKSFNFSSEIKPLVLTDCFCTQASENLIGCDVILTTWNICEQRTDEKKERLRFFLFGYTTYGRQRSVVGGCYLF